jgi:hypothetical protein
MQSLSQILSLAIDPAFVFEQPAVLVVRQPPSHDVQLSLLHRAPPPTTCLKMCILPARAPATLRAELSSA